MGYRSYVRNDGGYGVLLIVFNDDSSAVFAVNTSGEVYPASYWRDEAAFADKWHFTLFETPTVEA